MRKKIILLLLFTVLGLNSYSQISFEKGYYIDNSGEKVDCLIKNVGWLNNPTQFEYKPSEDAKSKKISIKSVKEFGVYDVSKYIRSSVNIDRSSNFITKLSNTKTPVFEKEDLFLKVLVEGKANLYFYADKNLTRFFFSQNNSAIEQLIFKKYQTSQNNIGENNQYKQQLWVNLKCDNITLKGIENLNYNKRELIMFFIKYNDCNNSEYVNFENKVKKGSFNLSLRIGLNNSSLSIDNSRSGFLAANFFDTNFDNELGVRVGVEAEYIIPFNKNKWGFIIEPTYQSYKSENDQSTVDYTSIELPIGLRHYFFLNDSSKFFVNGSFIFDFANGTIDDMEIKSGANFAFGIGYKNNDKYILELRYHTSRDLLSNFQFLSSEYNTISVILGYSLF